MTNFSFAVTSCQKGKIVWPQSVIPTDLGQISSAQSGLKTRDRCDKFTKAVQKLQKIMVLMKLEIKQETINILDKIDGGKTYFKNGTLL